MCPSKAAIIGLGMITTLILLVITIIGINFLQDNNSKIEEDHEFWAYNFNEEEYYKVNSSLLAIGDHCYIYMEEELIEILGREEAITAKAEKICKEFDNIIYPKIIDLAGHPDGTMGDIDGIPKIFILFVESEFSYYLEVNEMERPVSNLCEMIYIDYRHYYGDGLYQVIAHELHHLIWFNNDWEEPPFTSEALAQYAMYHAGYLGPYGNLVHETALYLPHPEDSPLYVNHERDYGSAYLFAFYIAEKYGVQILRDLISEEADGLQGIESVLQTAGYNITFNELFINWITALTNDKVGFENNLFGFEGCNVRVTSYDVLDHLPVTNKVISINHYAFYIHKLTSPPNNFIVSANKSPSEAISIVFAVHDTSGWHVEQKLHYEEANTVTNSISGSFIDEAYIITSYISEETPIASYQRDSWEPSVEISITIREGI